MAWVFALWTHTSLARLMGLILLADIVVWASTKRLLAVRADKPTGNVERIMSALGSWTSLVVMAVVSVGWYSWDIHYGTPEGPLDLGVSIWTMLLDVLVIIGANYTRQHDRKLLQDIRAELGALHRDKRP